MLNNDDIKLLMEALDALEQKASRDGFASAMIGMMLSDDKEKARLEAHQEMEKAKLETEAIEEEIILLKAKLIQMKDKRTVDEMSDYLKRGE